jgi:hypothetical protein
MLRLENSTLRVELLDPADSVDAARQGPRYCWGGYIWQVHDSHRGPLVSGPEFPKPDPTPFNGQGLPESFRHRTRDGAPLTWSGSTGLGIGIGILAAVENNAVTVTEPCAWTISRSADHVIFATAQATADLAYALTRRVTLQDRTVVSHSRLTNRGAAPLALQWFAHPFWALTAGRATVALPAGTTLPENPGFSLAPDGTLSFRRPFLTAEDSQFALLALPPGRPLELAVDHPSLTRVSFATDFAPDECPVWANAHTISVEPYLTLHLAPGETREWQLAHGFTS